MFVGSVLKEVYCYIIFMFIFYWVKLGIRLFLCKVNWEIY